MLCKILRKLRKDGVHLLYVSMKGIKEQMCMWDIFKWERAFKKNEEHVKRYLTDQL